MALQDLLPNTELLTAELVNNWNSVGSVLKDKYTAENREIEGSLALKYRHDFEGLLLYLDVPREHIYPHIIANDLDSSSAYDGKGGKIVLLASSALNKYIEVFT